MSDKLFSVSIDQVKGLVILLVVLGHINSPVSTFIFSFHIPLFFFLAGLFIKTSYSGSEYLAKGVERLIVPFMIFGAVGFFVTFIKNLLLNRPIEPLAESLTGLLFWADSEHMHHYGFVLWFLPALFWGRSITFFVVKTFQFHPAVLLGTSATVAWLSAHYVTLPFGLDKGLVALPWIVMGYLFYQYHERWLSSKWFGVAVPGALLALLVYLGAMQSLDLATKVIGNLWLSIPFTLSVTLLLIGLLYRCSNSTVCQTGRAKDILVQFGHNSMLVLILHVYTNNAADIMVKSIFGSGYWFVTFMMSVVSVYIVIQIKRRYSGSFVFRYL